MRHSATTWQHRRLHGNGRRHRILDPDDCVGAVLVIVPSEITLMFRYTPLSSVYEYMPVTTASRSVYPGQCYHENVS